ncbi:hypothetical protein [Algoriphagus persicinus]|uniref:hypothetical protein n=1 Tax=Algoriphagus persicinus TaxID=3108754 RepID=UPI002B3B6193|nr:hypothetical protein [Algoriphagus sp. E1-3-M2]MEB2786271.1 hypothetical protein [Algoriphagus sp. E1-3-M2]
MMPVGLFPFYWLEGRRRVTEVASMLFLTKSCNSLKGLQENNRYRQISFTENGKSLRSSQISGYLMFVQ